MTHNVFVMHIDVVVCTIVPKQIVLEKYYFLKVLEKYY